MPGRCPPRTSPRRPGRSRRASLSSGVHSPLDPAREHDALPTVRSRNGAALLRAVLDVPGGVVIGPGADPARARLAGVELAGADLTSVDLMSADMVGSDALGLVPR
ncbi:pentapeptide repeat-containing protein [Nocardia sp. bgisy134]|uniref:pentapeptide repeat-containing protein n=1 Tax=Nocardia sp. bgisy134 TaxID=3413789 RepID=UPI003D75C5E5